MFLRLLQHRPILRAARRAGRRSYGHVDDLCELMVAMVGQPAGRRRGVQRHGRGRDVDALRRRAGRRSSAPSRTSSTCPTTCWRALTRPVFGHLFGVRHHAIASIEKASVAARLPAALRLRRRPRRDVRLVPRAGVGRPRARPLGDPVWGASWDFDAEAEVAADAAVTTEWAIGRVGRPSDGAMWASVEATLREVVLPRPRRPRHRRQVAIHLDRARRVRPRPRRRSEPAPRRPSSPRPSTGSSGTATSSSQRHWREARRRDPRRRAGGDVRRARRGRRRRRGGVGRRRGRAEPRSGRSWPPPRRRPGRERGHVAGLPRRGPRG